MNISNQSLHQQLSSINDDHIITNVKKDADGNMTLFHHSPSSWYGRAISFFFGNKSNVKNAIKKELESKYGYTGKSFSFRSDEYALLKQERITVKTAKEILTRTAADHEKLANMPQSDDLKRTLEIKKIRNDNSANDTWSIDSRMQGIRKKYRK